MSARIDVGMDMPLILTAEQRAIRDSKSQRIICEANAGAAKTTTAALRMLALTESGADPGKILALCFSSPGAKAFNAAFRRIGMSGAIASTIRVGTVDDLSAARLAKFEAVTVERHDRPEEVRAYVLQAIAAARTWADQRFPGEFSLQGSGELAVEGLLEEFGQIKGAMTVQNAGEYFSCSPAAATDLGLSFTTLAILRAYEQIRTVFVDGDGERVRFRYKGDATYDLANMFASDDPPFTWDTHPLRLGIEAIVLDEMHDCNRAIFTVVKAFLQSNENASFLGVGDRDQVIHGRDGADACFMQRGFEIELGETEFLPLTMTHRFGPEIAGPLGIFADKKYGANPDRKSAVDIRATANLKDVLDVIVEATTSRRGLGERSGLQDIAVLLRHPGAAVELEHLLIYRDIPYESVGFDTFLERPEILFVRMLLTAATGIPGRLGAHTLGLAKRACWQFLGGTLENHTAEETAQRVKAATEEQFVELLLFETLQVSIAADVSRRVAEAMAYASSNDISSLPDFFAALNIREFARKAFVRAEDIDEAEASVEGVLRIARDYASTASLMSAFLQYDHRAKSNKSKSNRIILSTIADSKGLEFDHVIIPNVDARSFDGVVQDERNLFYVAASRARNLLTITYRPGSPSPYLHAFKP